MKNNKDESKIKGDGSIEMGEDQNPLNRELGDEKIFAKMSIQAIDRQTIERKSKKRGIINADEYFKDRFKLSLKDGNFCLFEHIDKNPIYINNFGMVSKLQRYIYNNNKLPVDYYLNPSTNQQVKHMGPYGIQILKKMNQKLDLLGNIDRNLFQGITVLSNNMYNAPVFYHKPKYADFFCSIYQDKKGSKKILLREIKNVYTVG